MSERGDGLPPISIVGDRGAGKTTMLLAAAHSLARDKSNIVLETIKPELFSTDDSIFVHVLVGLERAAMMAGVQEQELSVEGHTYTVAEYIDMALRRAALSRTSFEDRLHLQSLGPDQFAADFARLSRTEAAFLGTWRELVRTIVGRISGGPDGLLIVPIDDADLVPDYLPRLFLELRLLTASPHVIPIVCLNLRETRIALLAGRLQDTPTSTDYSPLLQHGLASTSDVKIAVEKQLTKALPADHRFVLTPVDLEARLDFEPLDSMGRSLRELLGQGDLKAISGDLVAMFETPSRPAQPGRPTFAAKALPGAPRELGILCSLLNGGSEGSEASSPGRLAAFLETMAEFAAFGEKAFSEPETVRIQLAGDKIHIRQRAEGVWVNLGIGAYGGSLWSTEDAPGFRAVNLALSQIGEITIAQQRRRAGQSRLDTTTEYWPDEFAAAFLVLQDLTLRGASVVRAAGSSRTASVQPGSLWNHVDVAIDGEPTDDRFFDLPAWSMLSDVAQFADGWNSFLDQSGNDSFGQLQPVSHIDIEWAIHNFVGLVVETAERKPGKYTDKLAKLGPEDYTSRTPAAAKARTRIWTQVLAGAHSCYTASGDEARRSVFRRWVECDLVQLLHPALLSVKRIDLILTMREAALSEAGRLQRGNDRALRRLEERSNARTPGLWLDGLVDLARRLDTETADDIAERIRTRRLESKIARLGRRALAAAIPVTEGNSIGTKSSLGLEERVGQVLDLVDDAASSSG